MQGHPRGDALIVLRVGGDHNAIFGKRVRCDLVVAKTERADVYGMNGVWQAVASQVPNERMRETLVD